MIGEFLGDAPGNFASAEAKDDFRQHREIWTSVQFTMYVCMKMSWKKSFRHMEPIVMMDALKVLFMNQVKHEQYKQLDMFLFTQDGRTYLLGKHICAGCLTSTMISQIHAVTGWRILLR